MVVSCPNTLQRNNPMDNNTLKTSFGKWISPINMKKLSKQVDILKQDYYTKKLTTESFLKIMLFAQYMKQKVYMRLAMLYWMKIFKKPLALIRLVLRNYHVRITN